MSIRRIINGLKISPLLDLYDIESNLGAAWSLRKLKSNYNGYCLQVRRSSDNSLKNIGFVGGQIDITTLLLFVGTHNGYVTIFYDQSGNNQSLIQNDLSRQPLIVYNGILITENNKPAIKFDGINDFLEIPNSTSYFKALHSNQILTAVVSRVGYSENPNTAYGFIDTGGALNTQIGYTLFFDDRSIYNRNNGIINIIATGNFTSIGIRPLNIFSPQKNNLIINEINLQSNSIIDRGILFINDVQIKTNNGTGTPSLENSSKTLKVGVVNTHSLINFLGGTISEIIIYLNDQSFNTRFIQSNINSYYNIY